MPLHPLYGHEGLRNRLAGAIASGRLPQALLFEGPPGVGKQRLALWVAQRIVCDRSGTTAAPEGSEREAAVALAEPETRDLALETEPCGRCPACRLVLNLSHPDVHWFIPVEVTRKGSDADRQVELVAEALAVELGARREQPLYQPPSGLANHGIAAVRLLARHLYLTPALARYKVFIVGDAERLVAQQGSPEAANALLKALEEPPANTVFVLTSSRAEALLPTVVSRVVRVRLARLPDSILTEFAQRELPDMAQRAVAQSVRVAEGSIGKLLATASQAGTGTGEGAEVFLRATRGSPAARYAAALAQRPFQARGAFTDLLDALLDRLGNEARAGRETGAVVAAISRVLDARALAQGNVNPQLVTAVLGDELWSGR